MEGYDQNPRRREKYHVNTTEVDVTERMVDLLQQNQEFLQHKLEVKANDDARNVLYFKGNILD